ncbi:MAG: SRPBCC family protein [Actinomycetota bacterium]|nr:SRPBCC family protein [Actinomycetota bacterium]
MLDLVRKGWPVTLDMTGTLPAPPAVVWELLTDWEHLGEWMLEASDFVVTSEQREGVGVEAEATIAIAGFRSRDRIRVSKWERGRSVVIDHLGWVRGTGEMHLTPVGEGETFLLWREKLWPPLGGIGALGLSLLKPLMHNVFRRDVRVLIALARARSAA